MRVAQKETAGLTSVEVLMILLVVGGCLALILPVFNRRGTAEHAQHELDAYATKLKWQVEARTCSNYDSDGDGYISCTASIRVGDQLVEKAVECGSGISLRMPWIRTSGCKLSDRP